MTEAALVSLLFSRAFLAIASLSCACIYDCPGLRMEIDARGIFHDLLGGCGLRINYQDRLRQSDNCEGRLSFDGLVMHRIDGGF